MESTATKTQKDVLAGLAASGFRLTGSHDSRRFEWQHYYASMGEWYTARNPANRTAPNPGRATIEKLIALGLVTVDENDTVRLVVR